jgi:hypothetical protein
MFLVLVVLAIVYEGLALYQNQGNTISEIIWNLTTYHPIVPFAIGFLMGHFFFQATSFWKRI